MSALGHKQTCAMQTAISALPPIADTAQLERSADRVTNGRDDDTSAEPNHGRDDDG